MCVCVCVCVCLCVYYVFDYVVCVVTELRSFILIQWHARMLAIIIVSMYGIDIQEP